ncbi:hypothetical protein EMCRGX_G019092 [Ephydatia muelleri]
MDAANRDAYIRQWVERVKEFNSAEETLDRGQTFCPSQQTLDSSFSSTFSNASAPPLLQHSSRDHLHRFVPSGAHQKLGRSMSSLLFSEHKPTTVHRVKYQSPVPSELPPLDLPSWELAVPPNPMPRKSLKPTYLSGSCITKNNPDNTEGSSSTIKDTPDTTEGSSSTIKDTPDTTEGSSSTIKDTPDTTEGSSSTTSVESYGIPEAILSREKPQFIAHPLTVHTRTISPHMPRNAIPVKDRGALPKEERKGSVGQTCVPSHQHQYVVHGCSSELFNTNVRFLSKRSMSAAMLPEPKQLSPSLKPSPICGVNSTPNEAHPSYTSQKQFADN